MSKIILILTTIILITPHILQADTTTIENQINNTNENSTYQNQNIYNDSGFYSKTEIINKKTQFTQGIITPKKLNKWISLYKTTLALQTYRQYITEKKIKETGEVIVNKIQIGKKTIKKGRILEFSNILNTQSQKTLNENILSALKVSNIIDQNGYINASNENELYQLKANINQLPLNITLDQTDSILKKQLFNLVKNECTLTLLTQTETTDYKSSGDNLFEKAIDYTIGKTINHIFFKPKTKTITQKSTFTPSTDVYDFYSHDLYQTFASYPFEKGISSQRIINNKKTSKTFSGTGAKDNETNFFDITYKKAQASPYSGIFKPLIYGGYTAKYTYLIDDNETESIDIVNANLLFGIMNKNNVLEFGFGPTLLSSLDNNLYIGLNFMYSGRWYIKNPVSIGFNCNLNEQGNSKNNLYETNWTFNIYEIDTTIHLKKIDIKVGQKTLKSDAGRLFQSLTVGFGFHL